MMSVNCSRLEPLLPFPIHISIRFLSFSCFCHYHDNDEDNGVDYGDGELLPTLCLIISQPLISQADQSFRDAVIGMKPDKEKHQMFADIHPKFGFPLAFRPKFQLNAILRRDTDIPMISEFPEQLILPFLWAQDGFGEPSDEMAEVVIVIVINQYRELSS